MVEEDGVSLLEGPMGQRLMSTVDDVSRVIEACFSNGVDAALLYAENLTDAFFDLSSGQAGAILQKLRNYRIRLAVVCPAGQVQPSSRFGQMLAEEQKGRDFGLFETRNAALSWIGPGCHPKRKAGLALSSAPQIEAWLLTATHVPDGGQSFTMNLAQRLRALGLPLWRMSLSLLTKHPELLWRTLQWHEDHGVRILDRPHILSLEPYFTQSPVALLVQGAGPIRVRLVGDALPFSICEDLKQQGGTDYYAQGLKFSNGEISYVSWATRQSEGFSDETLQTLDAIAPRLAQRIELESAYYATRSLLEVYLGRNAARRVVDGSFRRGGGELLQAAIWFCDLRDFTPMSDRMSPHEVVEVLDAYFDRVAGAVAARGGEVLKFIGDAILAIFPIGDSPQAACQNALGAAEDALLALQKLNAQRAPASRLAIGVALHIGQVMYGNIGSRERLDFTVISSAVNETCRLEALCKVLKTPLTMSETFVNTLAGENVVDLGEHALKGIQAKVRVFTLQRHKDVPVTS